MSFAPGACVEAQEPSDPKVWFDAKYERRLREPKRSEYKKKAAFDAASVLFARKRYWHRVVQLAGREPRLVEHVRALLSAPAAPITPLGGSMPQQPAAAAAAVATAGLSSPGGEDDNDGDDDVPLSGGPFVGAAVKLWDTTFEPGFWVVGVLTEERGELWCFEDEDDQATGVYDLREELWEHVAAPHGAASSAAGANDAAAAPALTSKMHEHFLPGGAFYDGDDDAAFTERPPWRPCSDPAAEPANLGVAVAHYFGLERCGIMHGQRSQDQREATLKAFRTGRIHALVATDVVGRGVDIPGVTHVVIFDFPGDLETYVHRVGRTGRNGEKGTSIAFFEPQPWAPDLPHELCEILRACGQEVSTELAAEERKTHFVDEQPNAWSKGDYSSGWGSVPEGNADEQVSFRS